MEDGEVSDRKITFTEAAPSAPTLFRYIVLEETCWTCPLMIATKTMYVAVAMEWYSTAQGETPEQAIERLEYVLMGEAAITSEHPDRVPIIPAPEDYQRVAESGDAYVMADAKWAEAIGGNRWPIVKRGTIDMAQSKMRLVLRDDK